MRNISYWAKHHAYRARSYIILLRIILSGLAFYVGTALYSLHIVLPPATLFFSIILFVTAAVFYPDRSKRYIRQKTIDFIVTACSFLMICHICNNYRIPSWMTATVFGTNTGKEYARSTKPTAAEILASRPVNGKDHLTRQEKKILKKEFRRQLKVYVSAKLKGDTHTAEKILLILLSIVVAVGLFYLVAGLACSLSCSGAEGLAVIVLLLGTIGIIIGLIRAIKAINKIGRHKPTG